MDDAGALALGKLKAAIAGLEPKTFVEGHELDDATRKRVPNDLVGRVLKQREAMRLLKKLG